MMSLFLFTAFPPNETTLKNVFENTKNIYVFRRDYSVPYDKWGVDSVVKCFVESKDPRKVRNAIFKLDLNGETELADTLMDHAELPDGMATQVDFVTFWLLYTKVYV